MVASLPPLACALCDHPIGPGAPSRRARCPRCGHRHGLGARHRLALAHIQRRRAQAAVDRGAADEARREGEPGALRRFALAVLVAAALPHLLRPLAGRIDLGGEAWLVLAVALVVAVAMAAALHVLLGEDDPAASTPIRVDAPTLDRALLDAEAAAWRAGVLRHGIAFRRLARARRPGAGLLLAGGLAAAAAACHPALAGDPAIAPGGTLPAVALAAALAAVFAPLGLLVAHLARGAAREVTAARRIAGALAPALAPALHPDVAAIASWLAPRWAAAFDLTACDRGAAVSIARGDLEALAAVIPGRHAPPRPGAPRLHRPESIHALVPFVTPPLAARAVDSALAAAIARDLQASGWRLAHDPAVGLRATRLAPSEAQHFTHAQLILVAQAMPALLDLAAALGALPPRELAARELTTLAGR